MANAATIPLATPALAWFGKYSLGDPSHALKPLASPLQAKLQGMPPATIINADLDSQRDDGAVYAAKLKAAGDGNADSVQGQRTNSSEWAAPSEKRR